MFGDRCGRPPYEIASKPLIDEQSSEAAYVCAVICSILGLSGNLVTTLLLLGDKSIRTHSTTPFLTSLAISDLIFSGFNLPLLAIRFKNRAWVMSYNTCELYPFFLYSNIIISAFSMCAISFNRYMGIFYSDKAERLFTTAKSWSMVVSIWILAMAMMTIPLTDTWGQFGYESATFSCTILPKDGKSPMVFLVIVGIVLPLTTMVIFYVLILLRVRRTGREMRRAMGSKEEETSLAKNRNVRAMTLKRERQLTKTLSLICAGFLVCFLPSSLLALFDPMPPCYKNPNLHVASYVIFWCSAFINPVIYVISNKHYRKVMTDLITKCKVRYFEASGEEMSTWYDTEDSLPVPSTRETSLALRRQSFD